MSVPELKQKLETIAKMADIIDGMEPQEAVRLFFSCLMLLGYDPSKISETINKEKPKAKMN